MEKNLQKFTPFAKVDSVRREVSGIVTAEAPDKDLEVCDYEKSKPYYKAVIEEIGKATDGKNLFPLRAMHQLDAVGKCIGFHFDDEGKAIEMTFKVIDDDAWKKVEERVYTGFSQGGRKVGDQTEDPVYKGCMRYVADPSEISLVDNPCLPSAHFAYVKADGSIEMRKFLKTEPAPELARITTLEAEVSLLKAAAGAKTPEPVAAPAAVETKTEKTKRVGDKDLRASEFAYVGDQEKPETWKLPIHNKAYAKNALAFLNSIPTADQQKAQARIVAAAKKLGVDVATENVKIAAIGSALRKAIRVYVNKNSSEIVSPRLLSLDSDMGKLRKGMYEVSRLAETLTDLQYLIYSVCMEQEWEEDDASQLPELLRGNIEALATTFVEMVNEETSELVAEVKARTKVA